MLQEVANVVGRVRGVSRRVTAFGAISIIAATVSIRAAQAQSTVAGFTPASFSVSEVGAATYVIPIAVPPGIAALEPKLSLVYSSRGGNDLLGAGWSLAGVSAISRCGRTLAQDGVSIGVSYNAYDRYCLDGERLVLVGGTTYGADGAEYRTEREGFARIMSYGVAGSGPAYFKVWTKSGQIIEYGNTADSRIEAQGKADVRVYGVNKVSDSVGNYLAVSYTEDNANGDYYVSRIDYTGNTGAGQPTSASVQFSYQARTDISTVYIGGSVIKTQNRLTDVKTYVGTNPVKDYRLAYDYAPTGVSRLLSVTECSGDGTQCLAPNSLGWQSPTASPPMSGEIAWGADGSLNGAGWYANNNSNFTPQTGGYWWGRKPAFHALADVNGDGFADLIYTVVGSTNVYVQYSNGSSLGAPIVVSSDSSNTVTTCVNSCSTVAQALVTAVGDVNGDGLADILFADGTVALANGSGFGPKIGWGANANLNGAGWWESNSSTHVPYTTGYWIGARPTFYALADVNGDGLADLIFTALKDTNVYVQYSSGSGFGAPIAVASDSSNTAKGPCSNSSCPIVGQALVTAVGDVNGDLLADILFADGTVALSNGSGFGPKTAWGGDTSLNGGSWYANNNSNFKPLTGGYWTGAKPAFHALTDVNGDGYADLIYTVLGSTNVYIQYSNGSGFGSPVAVASDSSNTAKGPCSNSVCPIVSQALVTTAGDVNGDGQADVVYANGTASIATLGTLNAIVSITNSLSAVTTISYLPISDSSVYVKDSNAVWPVRDYVTQEPMYVVSSASTANGIVGNYVTSYFYTGAKTHMRGGGFLGFRKFDATDAQTGIKVSTFSRQDYPYQGLTSSVVKTQSSGAVLDQVVNTWTDNPAYNALPYPSPPTTGLYHRSDLTQSVETSADLNGATLPTVTTTTGYDAYGNATSVTVGTGDGYTKSSTNTYTNDTVNWILGRLVRSQVTSTTP